MLRSLIIQFKLYYLSNSRLREVKNWLWLAFRPGLAVGLGGLVFDKDISCLFYVCGCRGRGRQQDVLLYGVS